MCWIWEFRVMGANLRRLSFGLMREASEVDCC